MKKQSKKLLQNITAVILSLLILVGLIPISDMSEGTVHAASLSNPRIVSDSSLLAGQKTTWDCVWFGSYPQTEIVADASECGTYGKAFAQTSDYEENSSLYSQLENATGWDSNGDITLNGTKYRRIQRSDAINSINGSVYNYDWSNSSASYHYFRYEPIKWRVLNVDGNHALLLADEALDDQRYDTSYMNITWEKSTIRSWLNGYGSSTNTYGTDYSSKNFMDTAFTSTEQNSVLSTELDNSTTGPNSLSYGGNSTTDKVFLLSSYDTYNTNTSASYGFYEDGSSDDEAKQSQSSTYAKAMGISSDTKTFLLGNCTWWLRSPGHSSDYVANVNLDGVVSSYGTNVGINNSIRPALYLDLSSSSWSSAGTVCSDGTINSDGTVSSDEENVEKSSSFSYKLFNTHSAYLKNLNKKLKRVKKKTESYIDESSTFPIPGIVSTSFRSSEELITSEYFVPQGICKTDDYILITAYHEGTINNKTYDEKKNSVMYVVEPDGSDLIATIELPNKYHHGGIAFDGENIWFCGNTSDSYHNKGGKYFVQCMKYSVLKKKIEIILSGESYSASISNSDFCAKVTISNKPSFLECACGMLWVGTYVNNTTEKEAEIIGYPIRNIASPSPSLDTVGTSRIDGVESSAQGMDIENGSLYISSSGQGGNNSVQSSFVTKYDLNLKDNTCVKINLANKSGKKIEVPKMNEEILVDGSNIYILFESSSEKYLYEKSSKAGMKTDRVLAIDKSLWR